MPKVFTKLDRSGEALGCRSRAAQSALLAVSLLLLLGGEAEAGTVTLSQVLPQTESGQDFDFAFSSILLSDGSDGVLTIHARGDYQAANPTEFLTWDIDSLGIGSIAGPLTGDATILQDNGINDVEWSQSFAILGSDLLSATSDGSLHVLLDLNLDDQFLGVNHLADTEFAGVSLAYQVSIPEPSSALLFGMGWAVIGWREARRTPRRPTRIRQPSRP